MTFVRVSLLVMIATGCGARVGSLERGNRAHAGEDDATHVGGAAARELRTDKSSPDTFAVAANCAITSSIDGETCQLSKRCQSGEPALAEDTLRPDASRLVNCSVGQVGAPLCVCREPLDPVGKQYELHEVGMNDACEMTLQACHLPWTLDDEPECTVVAQSEDQTTCTISQWCHSASPLTADVDAALNEYPSATCAQRSDGKWACDCSSLARSLSFALDADTYADDRCNHAVDLCAAEVELEPVGATSCEVSEQSVTATSCTAQSVCSRPFTVDGVQVELDATVGIDCDSLDGRRWDCHCQSGMASGSFELDTVESWEACTAAAALCPEHIDVAIGAGIDAANSGVGVSFGG